MQIISRADARRLGLKRYFTGEPCRKGHVAERYVSGDAPCAECIRLQGLAARSESAAQRAAVANRLALGFKTCPRCNIEKPTAEFGKASHKSDGLYTYCKPCVKEINVKNHKQYYENNIDKVKSYRRANKARLSAYDKEWREKNPERWLELRKNWEANNVEHRNRYVRERRAAGLVKRNNEGIRAWYAANRERLQPSNRERAMMRLTQRRRACPPWVDRQEIREIYKKAARIQKETGIPHHVDHIIPLRGKGVCGLHVPWNLQIIPATENFKKGIKYDANFESES